MVELDVITSVKIDNCARGEGVSGTAAVLRAKDGTLNVGYFTDNEVVVLVFGGDIDIVDIDPVAASVAAMSVGTAYDVGLQLRQGDKETVFFYDENQSCLGSVYGNYLEPDDYYVWDLSEECPEEIDGRIISELGLA